MSILEQFETENNIYRTTSDVGSGPRTDLGSGSRTDVGSGPRTDVGSGPKMILENKKGTNSEKKMKYFTYSNFLKKMKFLRKYL